MKTALKLGLADNGRWLTWEEYEAADREEGYRYEIIHGRLQVSPLPEPSANDVENWLLDQLKAYARLRPDVINLVTNKARVFIPGTGAIVAPEPDVAAYHDYPPLPQRRGLRWQMVSPILVAEVLAPDDPDEDLVRNPPLYLAVPSIQEYWVMDPRPDPYEPSMLVHRRDGAAWELIHVPYQTTYTTPLLPGFTLLLDPAQE
jgi:Uma2 family endonuclease